MVQRMQMSRPAPRIESTDVVTDSTFISNAFAESQGASNSTTATKDANLTMKLVQMK